MTRPKSDQTMLLMLAGIGLVGLLLARRHGVVPVLRTVNQALGIARVLRSTRPGRKRPARRVRPEVLAFAKPGS